MIRLLTCGFLLAALAAGQQAPRDAPPQPVPGATIRGHVTAAATGVPLHRVRLTLNGALANPLTAVTDTKGAFELTDVPPGAYSLTVARAGFLTIQYGQRRPREAGRTLPIRSGDLLEGIDVALYRGAVLAGRVTDELGDPSPGATVEAVEFRYIQGRRVPVPARLTTTNDAGEYRLSGLEPGTYQVRASTTDVWEGEDGKATFVHAVTYFPGVTGAEQPQSINVSVGQEIPGLEVRLIAGRAARITGVLTDANGNPLAAQVVNADRIMRTTGGALLGAGFGGTTRTDANGAFEFGKLAPGEFMVYGGGPNDRVSTQVILDHGDQRDVVLALRKPAALTGTIVTDEGTPPPFPASRVRVSPIAVDAESVLPRWGAASPQAPQANWSFRMTNLDGRYVFRVTDLPDEWMLKSVTLGGRDVTDAPLAIDRGGSDVTGLQIVLSRKGGKVSGEVVDEAGTPAPDSTVILFADNPLLWGAGSRYVRATRPDSRGRFSITGLPTAAYRLVARDYVLDGQWEDPEFLQNALRNASRVEVTEGTAERLKVVLEAIR